MRGALSRCLASLRREDGTVAIEALIVLPALFALYVAVLVWFDAYRNNTLAMKATYTVSDILSRQNSVDEAYMDGLNDLMTYLVPSLIEPRIRITSIIYDEDDPADGKYRLDWSYGTGGLDPLTQEDLDSDTAWMPIMGDDESVIVTETQVLYNTAFNVGWGPQVWDNRMVTRPRFAPRLGLEGRPPPPDIEGDIDDEGDETPAL